ncbi:excitatory amino acid transporter 3-like [Biomphalaria glabrata]|uniref:Amino acid transporter n=1 Tax=Biomphalaria glabrata TaxID=6526 RepID=A0A9W3AGP1_BIOGL|nr:excitatory amino acid transporter 3-like [Biomphalaria glabrata]XP_055886465.1 excitatory amino acid transporter 3-like [Biomphalaria glabrata]XP_055886466.1 excitatory amino acid transporter 3-like [Biomphalaria glabrata]KAI8787280.1 excitatory amino acid transporter 3 [Biomphalaria glabrata]
MLEEFDEFKPKPPGKKRNKCVQILIDNLLIILIVLGVAVGVGFGLGLRHVWSYDDYQKIFYWEFPGRILLNMLKLLILPLIVSSLITGMADLGSHASGRLGAAAIIYYLTSMLTAVIIGIAMALIIHPGRATDSNSLKRTGSSLQADPLDSLLDLISQCFPENLVTACYQRVITKYKIVKSDPRVNLTMSNLTNVTSTYTVDLRKPYLVAEDGTNVLGLIVFSIAMGIVINNLGEEGLPLKNFFRSLNAVTMRLVHIVIWYTPIGIIFLVASKFIQTDDIGQVLSSMGLYMATVLGGLAIHGFITLPIMYLVTTRKNPVTFALKLTKAFATAWGTASSSATMPLTMDCLVNKNKINLNIVRFVIPVGTTVNMDGTALYEAVACLFIAQVNGLDLSASDVIIVSLTATAAAIGAAGVPQAGLVTMVIVLTAVGLPADDITLILSIDWLLDRFRTVINVWGDCVGAGILDHLFRKTFAKLDKANEGGRDTEQIKEILDTSSTTKDDLSDESPPSYSGIGNYNEGFVSEKDQGTRL